MPSAIVLSLGDKLNFLRKQLSHEAQIVLQGEPAFQESAARWSDFGAPQPGAVVNVATEKDVESTVRWAIPNGVRFIAQAGGHGWQTTWDITHHDVVINLRGLRDIKVDLQAGEAIFGAGSLVGEIIEAAYESGADIVAGTCNSVGAVGALLGGGIGRFQGCYGLGVDNMLSARVVTAQGQCITCSPTEHSDLWWGLTGAGHNFGIVTSVRVKVYPQINEGQHFMSMLVFSPDQIETVANLINSIEDPKMAAHVFFMGMPPTFQPRSVVLSLWYAGPESVGRASFAPFYAAGPVFEQSDATPFNKVNSAADAVGLKGGRKPCTSASLPRLNPVAMTEIWGLYNDFIAKNVEAASSAMMFECYSTAKSMQVKSQETAYPHRELGVHGPKQAKTKCQI